MKHLQLTFFACLLVAVPWGTEAQGYVPPAVPKDPSGSAAIPPAVPKYPGGYPVVPPAVPKNPGSGFGVPPPVPKPPGGDFGVPPPVPKDPGSGFGVPPAVPKNPDGTPLSPDETLRYSLCGDPSPNLRYDQRSKRCYHLLSTEPCGENMQFYASSQVYGDCDCVTNSDVPLVYHPRTDRCYFVYQQAYCPPGQWLLFKKRSNMPTCTQNRCLTSRLKRQPWEVNVRPDVVPLNGNGMCVLLMSNQGCRGNEMVTFSRNRVVPTCSAPVFYPAAISPVGMIPCPAGSKLSVGGNCNPDIDWDF